jgi:hypothetical protein
VLYGCASTLTGELLAGTLHTFATKPEQSAPYDPLCEQFGQDPEHEPRVEAEGPSGSQRPCPHQYEKPSPEFARSSMPEKSAVVAPEPPDEPPDEPPELLTVRYAP